MGPGLLDVWLAQRLDPVTGYGHGNVCVGETSQDIALITLDGLAQIAKSFVRLSKATHIIITRSFDAGITWCKSCKVSCCDTRCAS